MAREKRPFSAGRGAVVPAICQGGKVRGGGRDILIRAPIGVVAMLPGHGKINNRAFETVPQPGLNGRKGYQCTRFHGPERNGERCSAAAACLFPAMSAHETRAPGAETHPASCPRPVRAASRLR